MAVSSAWRDEQLYQQAHFDPLTGLPNRLLLKDRLGQEIARCQRENRRFALLFIDIDRFKDVNDTLGHTAGDEVLARSRRAASLPCVRESDTVARLGGDEFTVCSPTSTIPQDARASPTRSWRSSRGPSTSDGQRSFLSASVGIAAFPEDGATAEELLKQRRHRDVPRQGRRARAGGVLRGAR